MSLRVISGEAKGRRLKTPPGLETRPTSDRVRQTLFDILGDVSGDHVLDLFAGSGALGIEALSRGASRAIFVESDPVAVRVVRENLAVCGFEGRAKVVRADAEDYVQRRSGDSPCDLAFLDPPYERGLAFVARLMGSLAARDRIAAGGRVVAESAAGDVELPEAFRLLRVKVFGRTQLTIAVREPEMNVVREGTPEATEPDGQS
ncbi:MAG TPA: 16S rRNA (guanine(966)-N(2))-methyltransferase RsmD [Actinomycetota bacterium]|nr:16S rRNA (guanine(966)-N(2))-methyltransferase RsmD [Actinomycetota bacterium]